MLRAALLSTGLLLLGVAPAAANLITNPEFTNDLSGWSNSEDKFRSPDDSDGNVSSGSVQFVVEDIETQTMSMCVPVSVGLGYEFSFDVKLDFSNNNSGEAGMVVRFKGETDCGGADLVPFPANLFETLAPDWKKRTSQTTSPAGSVAALVVLTVTKKSGGGGSVTANLDEIFFDVSAAQPDCGDPVAEFGAVTASDALHVLRSSVGTASCQPCVCDVNQSGSTTASDALLVLRAAVGHEVVLLCTACS